MEGLTIRTVAGGQEADPFPSPRLVQCHSLPETPSDPNQRGIARSSWAALAVQLLGSVNHVRRQRDSVRLGGVLTEGVEVEIAVRVLRRRVDLLPLLQVLVGRRQPAERGGHCRELGRGEVHVGALAQAVGEVARGGGHDGRILSHARLIAHAQRAARHLGTCPHPAVYGVVALGRQLRSIHLCGRRHPEARGDGALDALEHFAGSAEVADVGHARTDEDLVNLLACNLGEQPRVIGVVRRAEDGLSKLVHVDVDSGVVLGLRVGLHELGVRDPVLHAGDAPLERAALAIALGDHPLEKGDVGVQVLEDGLLVELDAAAGRRALGGRV
mmetsp:Transcript_3031/g.10182  ORF Transcript_3031/g.10182 Transcript_3031/m.10182 type:complete len:328 (+) Transcript_3031:368-1351(+)